MAVTYPPRVIEFARRCYAAGHSVEGIRGLVERHHGRKPAWVTVLTWVDEEFAEDNRRRQRRGGIGGKSRLPTWKRRRRQCEEWRGVELPYSAIAKLCRYYWALDLSSTQIEGILTGRTREEAVEALLSGEKSDARGRPRSMIT